MLNVYQQKVAGLNRFNDWEAGYKSSLSPDEKLEQFLLLLDMGYQLPPEQIAEAQQAHLEHLVAVQKSLRV